MIEGFTPNGHFHPSPAAFIGEAEAPLVPLGRLQ
jgi:hypothetical protein